jgi:hypothetical protein
LPITPPSSFPACIAPITQALVLTVIQARWQAGLKSEAGLVEALKDCPFVPCDPPPSFQPDLLSDALVIQQQGAPVYRRPPECLDPAQPVFAKVGGT